ncbi:hypothetical protein Thiowin_03844 [Thiorhodovibrio winogradskyi]|uniref:DUF502 domain-containing protein n=1 Tax=Thiorhodovibrio winogradskyi TaxID=77007 RepID=A0ABZ0SDU0_9GAMM|nr:DUF502 domain-containing protein [Thiorhodovibrio winogradskyi]
MSNRFSLTGLLTRLRNLFLQGIALLAPLALTLGLLVWLGHLVETIVGAGLRGLLPQGWYFHGLGFMVGLLLTLATGLLANLFLVRWLVNLLEHILDRIPLVKSVFQGLKDVARFLNQSDGSQLGRPVMVRLPLGDTEVRLLGFVMQEQARLTELSSDPSAAALDLVAVYLPMSYQVGGYTLYLDRNRISPLSVSPQDALRAVLTGGAMTPETNTKARTRRS